MRHMHFIHRSRTCSGDLTRRRIYPLEIEGDTLEDRLHAGLQEEVTTREQDGREASVRARLPPSDHRRGDLWIGGSSEGCDRARNRLGRVPLIGLRKLEIAAKKREQQLHQLRMGEDLLGGSLEIPDR